MVRWLRWHCPPDTGFEIRALAVWGRARYLSVTEAPHNTNFHTWMGKKQFCSFQTAETGNRTPDSGVKGSGANHYPRAPARISEEIEFKKLGQKGKFSAFFPMHRGGELAQINRQCWYFCDFEIKQFKFLPFKHKFHCREQLFHLITFLWKE